MGKRKATDNRSKCSTTHKLISWVHLATYLIHPRKDILLTYTCVNLYMYKHYITFLHYIPNLWPVYIFIYVVYNYKGWEFNLYVPDIFRLDSFWSCSSQQGRVWTTSTSCINKTFSAQKLLQWMSYNNWSIKKITYMVSIHLCTCVIVYIASDHFISKFHSQEGGKLHKTETVSSQPHK